MSQSRAKLQHHRSIFDGWRSITLALYMTLVGYGVLVGIPVISTAWVELLGFSEVEVGRVAAADLGGLSLGSLFAALLVHRFNRRYLVIASVALALLGNGLCMVYVAYEQVLWLRVIAGVGSGVYTAVAVANLGATSKPAQAYNLMLFAFAFSQALEMRLLPQLSMNGIYGFFIACFAVTLVFLRWVPPRAEDETLDVELDVAENSGAHHIEHRRAPAYVPWLCMLAIVLTYVNIGAFWTYAELAALDAGIADEWIGGVLVWGSLCSMAGCLFAKLFGDRFGLARPLMVALIAMASVVGMLASGVTDAKIAFSVFSFNFLWVFIDVFQMGTVANVDHSGRYAALIVGAQGIGQIVGPNAAASLLGAQLGYSAVFVMCGAAALGGLAVYGTMYLRLRAIIPALADAS